MCFSATTRRIMLSSCAASHPERTPGALRRRQATASIGCHSVLMKKLEFRPPLTPPATEWYYSETGLEVLCATTWNISHGRREIQSRRGERRLLHGVLVDTAPNCRGFAEVLEALGHLAR
jgi:hypothetical protein